MALTIEVGRVGAQCYEGVQSSQGAPGVALGTLAPATLGGFWSACSAHWLDCKPMLWHATGSTVFECTILGYSH